MPSLTNGAGCLPSLTGDSVFICDLQDDFVGGYDHGVKAGTMLVGDHNINKGGKFWTWGHLNYGHAWDCVTLTDEDGPVCQPAPEAEDSYPHHWVKLQAAQQRADDTPDWLGEYHFL